MIDVVIVGAGPTGLWAAAELALAGATVLILERAEHRSPHSKALGLHARTLEVLAMRGLADEFLSEGRRIPAWHFGMLPTRLDLGALETPYPFMLSLPQRRTEELFERRVAGLNVPILRRHEVIGLRQDENKVTLDVDTPKGRMSFESRFVLGADGVHSRVRRLAGIDFPGSAGVNFGFLGEVTLDRPPEVPVVSKHGANGAFLALALGGGRYRLTGYDVHRQARDDYLTIERLREVAIQWMGSDLGMRDPVWLTRFSDETRLARRFRKGRVFVAGDAAHISWPAGGVGMNVGIQDAMNLGWKLGASLRGKGSAALIDTYHSERWPVGDDLARHTLAQGALITATGANGQALRALFSDILATERRVMTSLAAKLSGLEVGYAASQKGRASHVGDRVPNLALGDNGRLFDMMAPGRSIRIRAPGVVAGSVQPPEMFRDAQTYRLGRGDCGDGWAAIRDAVVRPDGHLGWVAPPEGGSSVDRISRRTQQEAVQSLQPRPV